MIEGVNTSDLGQDGALLSGEGSAEGLDALNKALSATQSTGHDTLNQATAGSGAPLKVESLEATLKNLTYRQQDIRLWQDIPKMAAFNTVEEYNQLVSYGQDRGGFTGEGELPEMEDSTYVRRAQLVKFMGTTRKVTHPMTLVRTNIGDAVASEARNGTLWLLRKVNRSLVYANSEIVPQEFNGLYAQHSSPEAGFATSADYFASQTVIDLRGGVLTQGSVEDGAQVIISNFGFADTLYAPPAVLSGFAKNYYQSQRIILNGTDVNHVGGVVPKVITTTVGDIALKADIFLNQGKTRTATDAAQHPSAPGAVVSATAALVADPGAKFAGFTGDHKYAISAINRYGESALTVIGTVTVGAGQAVDLSFTDGGGVVAASGYVIYRSVLNDTNSTTNYFAVATISAAKKAAGYDGAAAGVIRDRNRILPNSNQAFMLQADTEVFAFKQLAPLMKMDLATLDPSIRFMLLLYGTPMLYASRKMVRFVNIGPYGQAGV